MISAVENIKSVQLQSFLIAGTERKLQENFSTGQRNVVAYRTFEPFAGAGIYKENWSWSFVIETRKRAFDLSHVTALAKHLTPQSFTLSSLYDAVEKDVWALGIKDVLEIEGKRERAWSVPAGKTIIIQRCRGPSGDKCQSTVG